MIPASPDLPPRPRHGCLWGCLALLAIVFVPILLAGGYGAWFLYDGYRHDPALRAASELVRQDGMARLVLGEDIQITGLAGDFFSNLPGAGSRGANLVKLQGSRGSGTLAVAAHREKGTVKLDGVMLLGPDGRRYDLLNHTVMPMPGGTPGAAPEGTAI